jgi:hypothetical protein
MVLYTGGNKYRIPIDHTGLLKAKLIAAHQPSTLLEGRGAGVSLFS